MITIAMAHLTVTIKAMRKKDAVRNDHMLKRKLQFKTQHTWGTPMSVVVWFQQESNGIAEA